MTTASHYPHHEPHAPRVALFQLTSALVYPDLEDAGTEHFTVEPTPYATAKQVWCHHFDPDDETPAGEPLRSYGGAANSREVTVYHPAARRNAQGYAVGHPAFHEGDRAFCLWNRQSGRWEILAPPLDVWRFELKTALQPGQHATAYLLPFDETYAENAEVEFEVYDALVGTLRGRAQTDSRPGAQGHARYMPDSGRWEITAMQQPARWIRFALTATMLYTDMTGTTEVLEYWDGYDPDPDGEHLTVRNCALGSSRYLFAGAEGAVGLACYNPEQDRYHVVQLECP
jgi:ketosteroid isomerase-like protein